MTDYYFLITAFPPLSLDSPLLLSFSHLKDLLVMNLSKKDFQLFEEFLEPIELYNIQALWLGAPLDERGRLSAKELEEELLVGHGFPQFVLDYLEKYEGQEERLRYFSSLYVQFYQEAIEKYKGFLKEYFLFERELRLILTALRSKLFGKDLVRELQFEDPYDPLVALILAQKDSPDFIPPREYELVKTLFENNSSDPKKLSKVILQYRLDRIDEMDKPQDFGIDRVLAYVAKFLIVETLSGEDKEKGMEQLSQYE